MFTVTLATSPMFSVFSTIVQAELITRLLTLGSTRSLWFDTCVVDRASPGEQLR